MKMCQLQKGLSIVELMVALLLGLFLVSGVTGMYISSKQTYRMTDNLSRLQESMRFSLEFMSKDIRMAGYLPCRFPPTNTNALINGTNFWFLDYFNFGIRGYEGANPTPASFPPEIIADVVPGSDAVAILKGGNLFNSSHTNFTTRASNVIRIAKQF